MGESHTQATEADASQQELEELALRRRMAEIGCKILVLSGKGGVGKSTVAANLAVSLALVGKKVGLLDVDLHGPSIPKILGLEGQRLSPDAAGGIAPIQVTESLGVVSIGLLLGSASDAVIWRGPLKYNVIRQFLRDVAWGKLDYLVVDSPPGTGDEPLSVAQMVGKGAMAILVTTPQDVAVSDVRRCVSFCKSLSLRVAGIVENMSGLVCPHCGGQIDLFKAGGGQKLAEEMGVPFLGAIPLDPQIVASGDSGKAFVQHYRQSSAAKAFAAVVAPIVNQARPNDTLSSVEGPKEKAGMKIAIPTAGGRLAAHFGHCEQFALVEVDQNSKTISGVEYLAPPPHEPGVLPRWLHEQGADLVIAGGMGRRAQGLFRENGMQVVVGAPADTPESVVTSYLSGTLEVGQNVCDH